MVTKCRIEHRSEMSIYCLLVPLFRRQNKLYNHWTNMYSTNTSTHGGHVRGMSFLLLLFILAQLLLSINTIIHIEITSHERKKSMFTLTHIQALYMNTQSVSVAKIVHFAQVIGQMPFLLLFSLWWPSTKLAPKMIQIINTIKNLFEFAFTLLCTEFK